MEKTYEDVQVIVVGLNRTGTVSLKRALEILLDGECYRLVDTLETPMRIKFWTGVCEGKISDDELRQHFSGYKAIADTPIPPFYKRFMEIYPNAKVILTVRNPRDWYKSIKVTRYDCCVNNNSFLSLVTEYCIKFHGLTDLLNRLWTMTFGSEYLSGDEETMIKCYGDYVSDVMHYVPPEKLLVMNIKRGWSPLCEFLNLPEPNCPFPRENSSASSRLMVKPTGFSSVITLGISCFTITGICFQIFRYVRDHFSMSRVGLSPSSLFRLV